jgi:tetratricopeptide (TPR) repeat protein
MSLRPWLIVAGLVAIFVFGPLSIFYATRPPRMEFIGPITADSPIGIAIKEGGAAQRARKYQKAVDIYTAYLAHESRTNWYAVAMLGERAHSYEKLGQIDRAVAADKAALAIDPKQARALEKLNALQPAQ